jgi:hypothetical protein
VMLAFMRGARVSSAYESVRAGVGTLRFGAHPDVNQ